MSTMEQQFTYPAARRDESIVDDYHGTKVPDPYVWLEDPDAEETKAFVDAQNKITMPYLEKCVYRDTYKKRLTEMMDYPKYGCPFKRGSRYFYHYNSGLQNQSVLYVQDSLDAEAEVFIDPNKLSEDGTIAMTRTAFSEDGEYCAYMLSKSGSDWNTVKFMKVATTEALPDVLERVKFSCLCWTHDGKGVFYNSYPQDGKVDGTETTTNLHQKLFYHVLGTKQSEDILCGEFPDNPKWMVGAEITDDGRYAVLTVVEGCEPVNRLYYCDLTKLEAGITGILPYVKLVDNFEAEYEYIANEGTLFTFKTNLGAPNYKLINIDFEKPEQENWTDLVAESETDVLEWVACVAGDKLVVCYIQDVKNVLEIRSLQSGEKITSLPLDVGTISGYAGRKKDSEMFYQFVSFLTPGVIFHCDLTKDPPTPRVFKQIDVVGFDQSNFETEQVFFQSKDGTKIPMFVVHRKGVKLDSNNPVFLYGYGGFNISIKPTFSVSRLIFMRHLGGVLAVVNLRGGGEYGKKWHKSGCFDKKQNVFDDFQCAAEYLIQEKYTQSSRIVINGGSNGGLLVGACVNQRPDLFGCAVAQVGVMDMLKFHKFTIGHAWTTDYGSPDNEDDFKYIYKYSPLHNIRIPESGDYPSILLLTADHDDRVVPLHSLKYIASLQHIVGSSPQQKRPLLIRVDTKAGHGLGKPTAKVIEECSDIYAFIAENLKLTWKD